MTQLKSMIKGSFLENEPMSIHTSYGIGGPAKAFITPKNKEDLSFALQCAHQHQIPVYFVGSGSNLLVSDDGIDGIVFTLGKSFTHLEIEGIHISAESGVMLGKMVKEATSHNLTGLENLIGVPGTVGGALVMNAGAFGGEISNVLKSIEVMTLEGQLKNYSVNDIEFSYRHSTFNEDEIIIHAEFELTIADHETIQNEKIKASQGRKKNQPLRFRSAGSVFKNPKGDKAAGFLIDKAGLKGTRSGDAEISTHHANFFINHGQAKAMDIVTLIQLARKEVYDKFGVKLDLEIKTLGFHPETFTV
ncbi:MAG: UDP-N-acetylmuramate dehydrogenase [Candidatus Marinimicrobia bacterium]|jgi:UDP-N-acetylmuramate dehydrogenase|nr:UDP-N-acetylmuramate dehydrogenase [Candidatus Neomarinimicrobiota bacterium]MBT3617201.1 UDP-N-acetylmuramate dehydrogenase [Candidatus Neomarinimicrobiota bacterium]MBT3829762.1 UDP-N-acetylmuramate dehydrogenase [Candidatus Neomarinimicrobiota bacterium]MBT3997891.1 UDP-N-acetylmuramate dehydrogenase [Candidatus Neomarinimicrobiota bacterium]MBT4281269.1 UDP-N-acetylmuramate dehydrogenase [Candidatus Neomarinimicrobiota bacterium]